MVNFPCARTGATESMDEQLKAASDAFATELTAAKALRGESGGFPWYPYGSLSNFYLLDTLITGGWRPVQESLRGKHLVDIGAADGETSFFLERQGIHVDIIDNGPTNFNGLRGARRLKEHFGSNVGIHEIDLDAQFALPRHYDFAFFLGILYHLKNPYFVLESLARNIERIVLSTRIASHDKPRDTAIRHIPAAYLVSPTETNNDATNYWMFTEAGLMRILDRTGWRVLDTRSFGAVGASDPFSPDRDERMFAFLESRHFR